MWSAESAGYNACSGADGAGAVQGLQKRCRSGAGAAGAVQAACTICTATSIISAHIYQVQGGAGGVGTPQGVINCVGNVFGQSNSNIKFNNMTEPPAGKTA